MDQVRETTYLINLDSRKDRLKIADNVLKKGGLSFYNRFQAVVGKDLSDVYIQSILTPEAYMNIENKNRDNHFQLTKGGLGCALSHIELWKKLVYSKHDMMLIFEDDIRFNTSYLSMLLNKFIDFNTDVNDNLYNTLDEILKKTEDIPWDVLLLQPDCPNGLNIIDCYEPVRSINNKYSLQKQNVFWGLGGYFIKKNAAFRLLQNIFPMTHQIDNKMSYESLQGRLELYGINPPVLTQDFTMGTDIQNSCSKCDINVEIKPYIIDVGMLKKHISNTKIFILILIIGLLVFYFTSNHRAKIFQ